MAKKPVRVHAQKPALPGINDIVLSEKAVWILLGMVAILFLTWMARSPRPYDDDSIDRYFMASAAFNRPEFFLSFWGRPLAILLYSIPSQAGYWAAAGTTIILSIGTCYFTFRTAVVRGMPNAWMTVPLLIAQPFFFITSFGLCTEPLAAFLLAWGLFRFEHRRDLAAVVILSMVPLARSELVILFPMFAWLLLREKKYTHILLLGTGLVMYQLAGMMATGDSLYLLSASRGFAHGQYANGPFDHYFERLAFITGPVIFLFILVRLVHDGHRRRLDILNYSAIVVLAVHVYLFWKGNVAHAGFLRHFAAVAPVFALLATDGMNEWFRDDQPNQNKWTMIALLFGVALLLFYYSVELFGNQALVNPQSGQKQGEYVKFVIGLLILSLFVVNKYVGITGKEFKLVMLIAVASSGVGYTLTQQKPLRLAPEQTAVQQAHEIYQNEYKGTAPRTMVAHTWFYFFDNYNHYLQGRYENPYVPMKKDSLSALPVGSVVVWDSHYSWRLSSDVQQADVFNVAAFKLLREIVSTDRRFGIYLFQKVQ